jgi:CubicO group peptidase (beta-lactamase class C family)
MSIGSFLVQWVLTTMRQSLFSKALFLLIVFVFTPATLVLGQETDSGVAQSASDRESLDSLAAEIDGMITNAREEWGVPGLAVAIVKDDTLVLSKGYGVREYGSDQPVDEHTMFAIASNSKAFTAAALAILVDEKKLAWDDRVIDYLPWFRLSDPLATNELRVRDLLCHRSGLGTFSGDLLWWGTSYSPQEVLQRAQHLPLESSFRSNYGYSNLMYLAAGEVIAKVSGMPWPEFVEARILKPLKMERTVSSVRDLVTRGNHASPHKTYLDRSEPIPWMNWDTMAAAGGIVSTAHDMSRWIKMQLKQGEVTTETRLFSEQVSHEMWHAQTVIPVSRSSSGRYPSTHFRAYGLGWSLSDYRGKKLVGHGGGYDGMYSQVMMIPEEDLGIVILTNSMTSIGSALVYQIADRFIDQATGEVTSRDWNKEMLESFRKSRQEFDDRIKKRLTKVVENSTPSHPLGEYAAKFRCPMYGEASVALEGEGLVLRLEPYPALVADLEHLHYDTFIIRWRNEFAWFEGGTAHFVCDSQGRFVRLELDVPNDDLWFHELQLSRIE